MSRASTIVVAGALIAAAACDRTDPATAPPAARRLHPIVAAATATVTNIDDDGPGSLRAALTLIGGQGGGTIDFSAAMAGRTITLATTLTIPGGTIVIEGPATGGITISGGNAVGVMSAGAAGGVLTLRNLTIANGITTSAGAGLLIGDGNAIVTLDHVTVSGNRTRTSAGEPVAGGGIYAGVGTDVTIANSTLSGNGGEGLGGGVATYGVLHVENSTVTANSAGQGGGIASLGKLYVRNSIIAKNTGGTSANCFFSLAAFKSFDGKNVIDAVDSCGGGAAIIVADPLLAPLGANGGPTRTHALLSTSPAIDAAVGCGVANDQRYIARPLGAGCDIGAFEFSDYITTGVALDASVPVNPNTGAAIVTATVTCSAPASLSIEASLTQTQKNGKATVTAQATGKTSVACNGNTVVAVSVAPVTGAFQNGTAVASVKIAGSDPSVKPALGSATVKMFWAHK